jgi:hypothetical protein
VQTRGDAPDHGTCCKVNVTGRRAAANDDTLVPLVGGIDDRDLFVRPALASILAAPLRLPRL